MTSHTTFRNMIRLRRVYEPASGDDGFRVLVERLWPRGVRKEDAAIDRWCKDIAPSPELRLWFSHDPEKWDNFRRRYVKELDSKSDIIRALAKKSANDTVTFVYSARDTEHNSALLLKEYIESRE